MLNRGCCRGTGDELRHDLVVVMPSAFANRVEQLHERRAVLLKPLLVSSVETSDKAIEKVWTSQRPLQALTVGGI